MIQQKYDAAVGDITITENRFSYVDFTSPFTEQGVAMVMRTQRSHSMWIFLEPFAIDLWLVSAVFFILSGLVVWVIEHRFCYNFKNMSLQQVGLIFWYSTLVFAQGERLMKGWSKFVLIIGLFVILILTSSYTASLSSMLTARQLQQFQGGGYIGYPYSNPLLRMLENSSNFEDFRLKPIATEEDYARALKTGRKDGGIAAVLDEIPYVKIFIAKNHDHYTMTNTTYIRNGFGFAFQKGSPFALDFSRAIAKLREDEILDRIEQHWFGYKNIIKDESPPQTNVLNFYSFRGLFLLMGITSTLALVISYVMLKDRTSEEQSEVINSVMKEPLPNGNTSSTLVIFDDSLDQPKIDKEENNVQVIFDDSLDQPKIEEQEEENNVQVTVIM